MIFALSHTSYSISVVEESYIVNLSVITTIREGPSIVDRSSPYLGSYRTSDLVTSSCGLGIDTHRIGHQNNAIVVLFYMAFDVSTLTMACCSVVNSSSDSFT